MKSISLARAWLGIAWRLTAVLAGLAWGFAAFSSRAEAAAGPSDAELAAADDSPSNWLTFNKGYRGSRYVPLDHINVSSAGKLTVVCRFDTGESNVPIRSGPVVYNGVLYATTRHTTYAIDANTCAERWRHVWNPLDAENAATNNGVAIAGGRVFRGTTDGHLLALDMQTGHLIWQQRIMDANLGEYAIAAPLVYKGLILIGKAGGDFGIRGQMMAFRVADGSKAWGFNTVPAVGESGFTTWGNTAALAHGGGGTWTSYSLDAASGLVLIPVGNPAPDFDRSVRPGVDLYTNSILALDALTGARRWWYQLLGPEDRDWDTSVVATFTNSHQRKMVVGASKDGVLHGIDFTTHKGFFKTPLVTQLNTNATIPPAPGLRFCPIAAVQWNGPAYSPSNDLVYLDTIDWCATAIDGPTPTWTARKPYGGWANGFGTRDSVDKASGWINAVNASTGAVRWRYHAPVPLLAGVTATAGNVLMTGDITGNLLLLNAQTGALLKSYPTGAPLGGGIVTYLIGGKQRVAVVSGYTSAAYQTSGRASVVIFGLP